MEFTWLNEVIVAVGKAFLNPLLYWIGFFIAFNGYRRRKKEQFQFQYDVFSINKEIRHTWLYSIIFGIIIFLITIGLGVVFTYEAIIILCIVFFIFSFTFNFSLLSASYTIGISFLVITVMKESKIHTDLFSTLSLTSVGLLIGILLFAEAILFLKITANDSFPELVMGKRGYWLGQHRLKKISIIPFFVLVPNGTITQLPFITIGEDSYSLFFIPFAIAFDQVVKGELPQKATRKLAKLVSMLASVVLILTFISYHLPGMAFIAITIAVVGRAYIHYKYNAIDKKKTPYFIEADHKLKVLGIKERSPADLLGIRVGDIITKINGQSVHSVEEFDEQMKKNKGNLEIELINMNHEVRLIESQLYQGNRLELGLLLTTKSFSS